MPVFESDVTHGNGGILFEAVPVPGILDAHGCSLDEVHLSVAKGGQIKVNILSLEGSGL